MKNLLSVTLLALTSLCSLLAQDLRTATLVGNVTDSTGAFVANASVTVTNGDTSIVTRTKTNEDGAYYVPFLIIGNYRIEVEAPGFKKFLQSGLILNAGETPRVNVRLEIGAITEEIRVTAQAALLETDTAVVGSITTSKEIHDEPIPQSKPQHFMYYQMGAQANYDGTYHILGQPETQLSYNIDGVLAKQALGKALGDTNTLITPPVDSLQEAQVFTTGIPAEVGHSAGGAYNLTTKSGTNELHFSAEERYINKDWLHRQVFNQFSTTTPFEYHNFNTILSGPIVLPKIYNGRNKTFFLLGYRLDYDHEQNFATVNVPTQAELNGDFTFNGLGYPIYDPRSIVCGNPSGCANGTGYTATAFAGNIIPKSRIDPVVQEFLSLQPYNLPNLTPTYTTTGPNNNYNAGNHYISDRQAYLGKIDQQLGDSQKVFIRYIWNKYRVIGGRENILFHLPTLDNTAFAFGLPEPIDERNIAFGHIWTISPTLINEVRIGYQRRNDRVNAATQDQNWAGVLGIPGVGPQTFPGFVELNATGSSFNFSANPGANARTLNENINLADNMTKIKGVHTLKWGYQGMRQRENDITATQPSGVFNFATAGSGNPLTPNTGNAFASFELGAVSSASFTTLLANFLPVWWLHQFYLQDDWKARRNLTLSLGVRYSYETPANTQYGLKSNFSPTATDSVTGMVGGLIHPTGGLYKSDRNNFTPRLGMAWNFHPNFVFRGSFDIFTVDLVQNVGQDEYTAQTTVQQPNGSPYPAFYLSQGPGPITYNINSATHTATYAGSNFSQRTATYIDPALRNPYTMNWSGGVQWEFRPNYLAEVVYAGSAGVALLGTTNINVLPQSIYNSTDTKLLDAVFANTQSYLRFPNFGTINETGNFGHSTYHAMIARLQHRYNNGLSANFMFTYSKNLVGGAPSGTNAWQYYNWNLTKAIASTDQKFAFVNQVTYELPFGKSRRWVNNNAILDQVIGGWQFLTIQSIRSGLPVAFTLAGSPYRYLPGEGNSPSVNAGVPVNVDSYQIGPNMWPQSAQNSFFNINAFANPAPYTPGNAGFGIARTGWLWWPQYSITKTWAYHERYKLQVRMDANNLFPQTRWLHTANSVVNFSSPQLFGKFPAAGGYAYSNFYGENGTLQGSLRLSF